MGENNVKKPMASILEMSSLDEFVQLAQLSKKKFDAEKYLQVVTTNEVIPNGMNSGAGNSSLVGQFIGERNNLLHPTYTPLKVPRRPAWTKQMTAHEIETQENMAFLEWRRDIASIEQGNMNLAITPFEKNIDIWRQLWRVIEKSDLLLQVSSARF